MTATEIIHNLTHYYCTKQPQLINPHISLDWVNTDGWESEIYAFSLTTGEPNQRHVERQVLRLLTGGRMADAEREYRILALLNRANYPVPKVYALGGEIDGFDYPFIIMQCIEGGNFADRFFRSLTTNHGPLNQFIDLFRRLHTLDWRLYTESPHQFENAEDPYFHFDRILANYSEYLNRYSISAFEPVMAWLIKQRPRAHCSHSSIVHLDFHHNNILEDADGKLYVIDWTGAEISDYRFDLAWTLTLALAYRGEAGRAMILDAYQQNLGQDVPELDVFEVATILRRIGTVMISLLAGAETLGMRPEAIEAMRRDLEPLTRLYTHMCCLTGLGLPGIKAFLLELGKVKISNPDEDSGETMKS